MIQKREFFKIAPGEIRREGYGGEEDSCGRTFACYCDSWLSANDACLKLSSHIKYEGSLEKHIKPYFGAKRPSDITSGEVEEFTRMLLQERGLAPGTVRSILTLFHSVFAYAKKRTAIPLPEPEIIYPRDTRKKVRVMNEKEEEQLMRLLSMEMDSCKFGIYMSLRTGMRIGEICALRWRDISFETCTISVCHTVQRIRNQDGGTAAKTRILIGTPKSDSSYRTIPLMPDMAALCRRFYSNDPGAFVLTGTDKCMDPRKLQRRLKGYTRECGIESVHFHTLRHTFATRCIEAGFDVKTLSELLGHSNIGITMNQYVHPNLDSKRENMSRLKTILEI